MKIAIIDSPMATSFANKVPLDMELYNKMVPDDFWVLRNLVAYSEEQTFNNNEAFQEEIKNLSKPSDKQYIFVRGTREDFKDANNIARIFAAVQQIEYSGGVLEGDELWITEPTVQQVVKDIDPWKELHHVLTTCCNHFWTYSNANWYSCTFLKNGYLAAEGIDIFVLLDEPE